MRHRWLVLVVVLACGCRRKHDAPSYASDTSATSPGAAAAPLVASSPSGSAANPLGEPVLPPRDQRTPMPDGGTLNGDPRGPRAAVWQSIIEGAMPALQACFDRASLPPGEIAVKMHYTVELPGYTGGVTASGPAAPRQALDCCIKVISELRFPEFRGTKVERDLAFTWVKREANVDGGAPRTR